MICYTRTTSMSNLFITPGLCLLIIGTVSACCPDGWIGYGQSCYKVGEYSWSYENANQFCKLFNASLINIESSSENSFIQDYLRGLKGSNYWIGLTDKFDEGRWVLYPSGIPNPPFFDWYPGQPNQGLLSNCAAIWASRQYHWVDEPCSKMYKPLCEKSTVSACCPDGWIGYGHSCYMVGKDSRAFEDAKQFCRLSDAGLININSFLENSNIHDYLRGLKGSNYWMGLTDKFREGRWVLYPSGAASLFFDWYPGQPNQGIRSNCAAIWASRQYHWVDEPCAEKFKPLCEKWKQLQ